MNISRLSLAIERDSRGGGRGFLLHEPTEDALNFQYTIEAGQK